MRTLSGGINDQSRAPRCLAVDTNGNVYLAYWRAMDIDPGPSVYFGEVAFAAKFAANGDAVWSKALWGQGASHGVSIATDAQGNVYFAGDFTQALDAMPGPGFVPLTSNGGVDIFLLKFDADGDYVWSRNIGGSSDDAVMAITVDANGNPYLTGGMSWHADIDPGPGTQISENAGFFVLRLNSAGNYSWGHVFDGGGDLGHDIVVGPDGTMYVTGEFTGQTDFDPGAGTAPSTDTVYCCGNFVVKLSPQGLYQWHGVVDGSHGLSIALDSEESIVVGGLHAGAPIDYDMSEAEYIIPAIGAPSAVMFKMTQDPITLSMRLWSVAVLCATTVLVLMIPRVRRALHS